MAATSTEHVWIVTGASTNHFRSLCQFLQSLPETQLPFTYVWDLGLSEESHHSLQSTFPSLTRLRRFPYEEYPPYFDIHVAAGEYAWKPVAILRTALEIGNEDADAALVWCDAGNRLVGPLKDLRNVIVTQGVYSPISAGTMRQWTHPGCLAFFGYDQRVQTLRLHRCDYVATRNVW
jgi:hypothetical protein